MSSVVIVGAIWSFVDDDKLVVVIDRFGEPSFTLLPNRPEKLENRKKTK